MGAEDLLYDDEQQLRRELVDEEYNVLNYVRQATQDQAEIIDDLVAYAPNAPGEVLYPLAQSVRRGEMTFEQAAGTAVDAVNLMATRTIERQPEPKNWWDKITEGVFEGVKKTTKYGIAALEFLPQTVNNLAARNYGYAQQGVEAITGRNFGFGEYEKPESGLFDGLFASTDIGALLSGAESGNGYFIGEAAKEFQEERARAYRGTISGETWTLGRGFANNYTQPDSQMFNITSGLVDAAAAIAIPSVPGSKTITATARTAARPLGKADEAAQSVENALRSARRLTSLPGTRRSNLAGITYSSRPHIDRNSVGRWLESNEGKKVKERLVGVNSIEEAADMFRNADADFWLRLTGTKSVDDVDALLRERLGLQGLARTDDLRIGRMFDRQRARFGIQGADTVDGAQPGRIKSGFQSWYARNFTPVAGREMVVVSDDIRDLTQTIRNARDYLRTLRVSPEERETVLKQITESLLSRGVDVNIQDAMKALDDVVIRELSLNNKTVSREARKRIRAGQATAEDTAALKTAEKFHRDVFSNFRNEVGDFDLYGTIDESANTAVIKGLNFTADGDVIIDAKGDLVSATAHIPSEMRKFAGYMPDARRVRRASARFNFMWTKHAEDPTKWGDPKLYTAMMDKIQQDIWRPATLMTGGYMFRNMIESVIRAGATPGIKAGVLHPLEWMRAVSRARYGGDVNGADFAENAALAGRRTNAEYIDATNAKPREAVDVIDIEKAGHRSGHYELISRPRVTSENKKYVPGVANELRLMANTPLGRIAADVMYQTGSREQAVRVMREWLSGADDAVDIDYFGFRPGQGKEELARINSLWQNKRIRRSDTGEEVRGSIKFVDESGNIDMENLSVYLDQVILERLERVTGKNNSLLSMIADSVRTGTFVDELGEIKPSFRDVTGRGSLDVDSFEYSEEMLEEIRRLADDPDLPADKQLPQFVKAPTDVNTARFGKTGTPIGEAWRRTIDHFFGNVFSKKEAFLNRSPVFRQYYYRRIDDLIGQEGAWGIQQGTAQDIIRRIEQGTVDLAEQRVLALKTLSKKTDENRFWNGKQITKDEYDQLVREANEELRKARELFDDDYAAKYVGSRDLWEKIKARAADNTIYDDALDIDQLDIASKAFALEETKTVFFNAADKSNFADILRIAAPFGPAWAEMTKFYYKQVLLRPNRIKNMGVTAQGFRDMDPDGDGNGFIYRDPTSGEMVFNYPFSDWMIPFISAGAGAVLGETLIGRASPVRGALGGAALLGTAGLLARDKVTENLGDIKPELVAPVRSISMSFQVIPGFGPAVQIAANQILGSKPQADQLLEIIDPFGSGRNVGLTTIAPAWLEKVVQAISSDPESDRMYGDMLIDSYRALYTSGNYDNTDEESMAELRADAESLAEYLLAYRGFAQFLGPVRGDIQFNIPTAFDGTINIEDNEYDIQGDYIPSALLSATFRAMQESDYENAVVDFIRTFGPNVMMYTAGKTRAKVEGLDASAQFGDWERNNVAFTEANPDVYGYFAPIGTEFDLQTYLRQIEQGRREKITDPNEIRMMAEAVVGKALYMDAQRDLPDKLTDAAEMELRMYRQLLEDKLPGFEFEPLNIRERDQILDQVINAARSSLMDDNRVAIAARLYADYREDVLAEARDRNNGITPSLNGKKYADLRRILREYGDQLTGKFPEFERLYSRVFFEEVDALA